MYDFTYGREAGVKSLPDPSAKARRRKPDGGGTAKLAADKNAAARPGKRATRTSGTRPANRHTDTGEALGPEGNCRRLDTQAVTEDDAPDGVDKEPSSVKSGGGLGAPTAVYNYEDADGKLLFQTARYEPKTFRQRRPDPADPRRWVYDLHGVDRVLYRLPELRAADPDALVFVVEGEKDADRLAGAGLVATTNPMGAGKWRDEFSDELAGRDVVVLPDNDIPGKAHALKVARSMADRARSVRILRLPGLPPKGDVCDFLDAGGTAAELVRLARETPTGTTLRASPPPPPPPPRPPAAVPAAGW
jgi:hypothetical protein